MRPPDTAGRFAAIAVHDVSPATWPECRQLLSMLDGAGARHLSLLVVPNYHRRAPVVADRAFRRAMDARLALGDELVLHGMFHSDDEPSPRTLRGFIERRLLTRSEGEFAAISASAAAWRLARGVELFETLGWPLHGFVAPAWLMSEPARSALAQCGHPFDYVTVRRGVYRLPEWSFSRTANLCYSPWNAPRRAYSAFAIRRELRHARGMSLLRLSLHPQDARVPQVLQHWERLVRHALAERRSMTKREWVLSLRDSPGQGPLRPSAARFASAARPPAPAVF